MAIQFEELLPLFGLNGDASVSESAPVNGSGKIVRTTEDWQVDVNWNTSGPLNNIMAGKWKLAVLLEKMGHGEFALANNEAEEAFVSAPHAYSKTFNFAAGSVPPGLYRVLVTVTMVGPANAPGPIAGYEDLGMVQFYDSSI